MTDDESPEPRDAPRNSSTRDSESRNSPARERVQLSERVAVFDAWPEPDRSPSTEALDIRDLSSEAAVFKARVQRGGRISIPDAERESLGIRHGQIVQAIVFPLDVENGESEESPEGGEDEDGESDETSGE